MWENRKVLLGQELQNLLLLEGTRQARASLSHQEYVLAHTEMPSSLQAAEAALRRQEAFMSTMDASEEKIVGVLENGRRLLSHGNLHAESIQETLAAIDQRHKKNREAAVDLLMKLRDNRDLQKFLQDCQELSLWIGEEMLTAQDQSYDGPRGLQSQWHKHQAFRALLQAHKGRLDQVQKDGLLLVGEQPQTRVEVEARVEELVLMWAKLETTTQTKAQKLFQAHRAELLDQAQDQLDQWLDQVQDQTRDQDLGQDLASVNILLKRQQMLETQVEVRQRELQELLQEEVQQEVEARRRRVEEEVEELLELLRKRRNQLVASRELHQFHRDLEDEILWVQERLPLASSTEHGQ
ncbi:spectrin beta chain, non-erythrocytic 1-like [Menidia menidia]